MSKGEVAVMLCRAGVAGGGGRSGRSESEPATATVRKEAKRRGR